MTCTALLSTYDPFVHCFTLVDDLIVSGQVVIACRPGPVPGCGDAEVPGDVLLPASREVSAP